MFEEMRGGGKEGEGVLFIFQAWKGVGGNQEPHI